MTQEKVSTLINCLTNNEDLRQELWVHYLSGNSVDTFADHLHRLSLEHSIDEKLRNAVIDAIHNPPSEQLKSVLERFSEFEQSIMCLLALGLNSTEVSGYKKISDVRIRQTIDSIASSPCWKDIYGIEEKTD